MIISLSLFFFSFFFILIDANELYQIGIINHRTQWYIHCPENHTRIINPLFNDQPLIPYQCPYGSLPIDIVPIEIDFTFICRLESRLIWIIVDLYQYNDWLWSQNLEPTNISIKLNEKLKVNESKVEVHNYKNRFIIINAFFVPFEQLDILFDELIEIDIEINRCKFSIQEKSKWKDIMINNCQATQSKTLQVQYAQCDFFPKLLPIDDNVTNVPDFHVVLSIDEQQKTIETTTTRARVPDYYVLFNEHYRHILSTLSVLTRASSLITFIFIFTIIIFILLVIFFVYILCYHYHIRSRRKSSLLI